MYKRILLIVSVFLSLCCAYGQHVPPQTARNPVTLSKAITAGKTGDHEKFEAIFRWVATNIHYNYGEYYAPSTSPVNISQILSSKSAICMGYAMLMDTLCSVAGITNVSVFGYAKDELFDINDSIYLDNHAWNAVRLDGLWYLYDVTWSSGTRYYKLNSAGSRVSHWLDTHPATYKKKKIRRRRRHLLDLCGSGKDDAYYYKRRYINDLLRRLAYKIPVRARLAFDEKINLDHYLCDPALFLVTHVPADPIWILEKNSSIRDVEKDSAYYYLNDSTYKTQTHEGRDCPECDAWIEEGRMARMKGFLQRNETFNPKNRFIRAYGEFYLAEHYKDACMQESDSARSMALLDSSGLFYQGALTKIRLCKRDFSAEHAFQKQKNKKKESLLLSENKQHIAFVKKKVKETLKQKRNYKELSNKSKAFSNTYYEAMQRAQRFRTNIKTEHLKDYPDQKIADIQHKLDKKEELLDTLKAQLHVRREAFDSLLYNLALNIWPQGLHHDSLVLPVQKCIRLRRQMKDNYKKQIVDLRRNLVAVERQYDGQVNHILYTPAAGCGTLFDAVSLMVKKKNALQNECLNLQRELMKAKQISRENLNAYRKTCVESRQEDYCWVTGHYPKLYSVHYGFTFLEMKQQQAMRVLEIENAVERERAVAINRELKRRFRKHTLIATSNARLLKWRLNDLKRYRKILAKN